MNTPAEYALRIEWDGIGRTTSHDSLNAALRELTSVADWVSFRIEWQRDDEVQLLAEGHIFGLSR